MPLPLPSSFASAAAGINQDSKKDGGIGGEWTRSRMNGATQTFRRPSVATNLSHSRDSSNQPVTASTPTSAAYIPPHMTSTYQSRNGSTGDSRYSKEDLLNIFKGQRDSGALGKQMSDHFLAPWNPLEETSVTNGTWGKKEDQKESPPGPEVCWDHLGRHEPLGLIDMTEDERELFTTTVNSPLKPPPSSASKDNTGGVGGRKASISHSTSFSTSSPSATRPGTRRRETQDSTGNPMSPTGGSRFFREETNATTTTTTPPPSLLRRKTDLRDTISTAKLPEDKEKPKDYAETSSPFGSLKRSATNPVVPGLAGPSSPWTSASQTASLSPMGAFGSFSLGTSNPPPTTSTAEKRPGFGSLRGESRFKGLLSKDSSEDVGMLAKEKGLPKEIERLTEDEGASRSQSPWNEPLKTRATRSDTNPFDEPRSGSAALGGSEEVRSNLEEIGFGAFGMTAGVPGLRDLLGRGDGARDSPSHLQGLEPTSPTNTNPYQSPRGEKVDDDVDTDGSDVQRSQHPGLSGLRDDSTAPSFGSIRRGGSALDMSTGDRSQTSSVGPNRGFSNLGGLGALPSIGGGGAWPSAGAIGTPTRERPAFSGFGDPIFGSMGEMQSPSLSTLGAGGFFGSHGGLSGTGSIGRASKMGSLFPSLQEHAQGEGGRQDELSRSQELKASVSTSSQAPATSAGSSLPTPLATSSEALQGQQNASIGSSTTLPTAQQRTMVMPDRMRWIYRDPQGNIQGPWSGLEMHDWFKAGFFTAELQVKKLEDPEFEPLAQLVRRIGNSREPFLVPQIGIPHGPEPNQPAAWGGASQPGTAQPPFANSFPTFGTTLTAEQQNALERRKQEEQYLMARQKEHLAQQQAMMKQMQLQGGAPQLQHHSSAHSLHSQPSFGSITSPTGGYQQSPIQGPIQPPQTMPGYFDAPFRQNALPLGPQMLGTDFSSHDELPGFLDRLNINRAGPFPLNTQGSFSGRQQEAGLHPQQVSSVLQDRVRLQQEQEQFDKTHPDSLFEQQARDERLRQFHALRSDEDEALLRANEGLQSHATSGLTQRGEATQAQEMNESLQRELDLSSNNEPLSLSQQVQKAATAQRQQQQQQQQQKQAQAEAAWAVKGDSGLPHPFPPPPSSSPLPAPAAQRNRQHVADALAATSRSQNQTPVETPSTSIAPWAKDSIEAPKGPSLKEIQEAEARSAAQREEIAAQARRAQLLAEQERLSQAQQATAPGLPSTANWASSATPVTPSSASSVWSKPVTKATGTPAKTLAQIQKEEEARKQKLAQVSAVQPTATNTAAAAAGKRYADLASKGAASPASTGSGAWTTVGVGGKAKVVPPATPLGPRSTSATIVTPPVAKPRPTAPARTSTVGAAPATNPNRANEEFTKWAKITLGKGLNSGINVDDFVQQLLFLPAEAEIISDSVYANSQTLDGRRFAEEFIRRRKLADKGIVDPVSTSAFIDSKTSSSGGWSEVAKKSSSQAKQEEDASAAFKVVASKKKGKR